LEPWKLFRGLLGFFYLNLSCYISLFIIIISFTIPLRNDEIQCITRSPIQSWLWWHPRL